MKTIPTIDLPDSTFRRFPICIACGQPVTNPSEPCPVNAPYGPEDRCLCGSIIDGVDAAQLRVKVYPVKDSQPIIRIVSCPMCPNRR